MRIDIKFEELSTALDMNFTENSQTMAVDFTESDQSMAVDFGDFQKIILPSNLPIYAGNHTITPRAKEVQVLETKDKVLLKDLTVKEVPYYETSNLSGGNTVYIGTEVNE